MTRKCGGFFCSRVSSTEEVNRPRMHRVPSAYTLSTPGFQRMDGFAFDQHRDVFLDAGHPGLGLFGVVDPVKDCVAIGTIKRFEEALCLLILRQSGTEI